MSFSDQILHERAVKLCRAHRKIESEIIKVLQEIEKAKMYKRRKHRSLFQYATKELDLSSSVAYAFIAVARKSSEVSLLNQAILREEISVSTATRMISAMTNENAKWFIEFAKTHTHDQIDFEVAKLRPKSAVPDRARPLNVELMKVQMSLRTEVFKKLERVQSLVSSQKRRSVDFDLSLDEALSEYLERHDPVVKAERVLAKKKMAEEKSGHSSSAQKSASAKSAAEVGPAGLNSAHESLTELKSARGASASSKAASANIKATQKTNVISEASPEQLCVNRVRKPLTAEQKHTVFARDKGQCTHINDQGERCDADRWLDVHHIVPVSQGGSNEPENLTTLCSFHHDLAHQLSLPIEGQVTWLRSPIVAYG
jgi:hypothetical protein